MWPTPGDDVIATSTHSRILNNGEDHTSHVRVYGESPNSVALQIRTKGKIYKTSSKSYCLFSHASLTEPQAKELYASLGAHIESKWGSVDKGEIK